MNKKAQAGPLAGIVLILMFLLMWALWLGPWLIVIGQSTIETNHLTGIEAFAYANLNIIVLFGALIGMMGFMYFTMGRA